MAVYREEHARTIAALRRWATLLDSAFQVPGLKVRFGLDPILGLLPGLGDLVTPLFSIVLLVHAVRLRIPRLVMLRMVFNAAVDFAAGEIPILGDLFDVGWKANLRNLDLLERSAHIGARPRASDWAFVGAFAAVLLLAAAVPSLVLLWLWSRFGTF